MAESPKHNRGCLWVWVPSPEGSGFREVGIRPVSCARGLGSCLRAKVLSHPNGLIEEFLCDPTAEENLSSK